MSDRSTFTFSRSRMLWLDPFMRLYVRRRTHGVYVDGELVYTPGAVNVLMPQHVSRLDGFIVRMIQRQAAPKARLVTIMLDRQLKRYPVFKKAGAFGISPGSTASGRDILRMVRNELAPGDCVVIFPQGRIEAVDADLTSIQHGYRSFEHQTIPTHFVPMALSVEALTHSKPSLFVRIGSPVPGEQAAEAFRDTVSSLRSFLREHGETADAAWPGYRIR